ncbi:hypothetical protein EXIGLDRAFT_733718 [Exidia glandulosa HHB12029]|uniref:Uncharacterized protein n=1 Tax=Exidia glandulosa HHB12029 TaxID=1314781 RepID=A0A165B7U8_EXIGL|nr:hypothetical protein EXIGLDRAFT_733718 [Exidia glandulosa HHB12029]
MLSFPPSHKQHRVKMDAVARKLAPSGRTVYDRKNHRQDADIDPHIGCTSSSDNLPPRHANGQVHASQPATIVSSVPILRAVRSKSTQTQASDPVLVDQCGPQEVAVGADAELIQPGMPGPRPTVTQVRRWPSSAAL